ncbi:MAG TPA: YihY/virulence factor BrkB family protein [Thermoanaerobaculia bacterium]|nr:YihY/virulence factor BrkB family protein [Thermoanaerobaculia bacterium]
MPGRARLATTIRSTLTAFRRHNASRFGAALAFYIVFSITPTLLIAIGIAGAVLGRARAEGAILGWIGDSFGSAAATAIASLIKAAVLWQAGWLATILGISSLYFGLAGVYRQIDDALQTIWRDGARDTELTTGLKQRLASMIFVVAAGVVVLVAVIADGTVAVTANYAAARLAGGALLWRLAQLVTSALLLTVLFAVVFRYLAGQRVTWSDAGRGAAVTAILFVIGKFGLGIYLSKAAVGSPFGAAGSIVVVMLWSYWSAQIFFFGLEFTHVYARQRDSQSS